MHSSVTTLRQVRSALRGSMLDYPTTEYLINVRVVQHQYKLLATCILYWWHRHFRAVLATDPATTWYCCQQRASGGRDSCCCRHMQWCQQALGSLALPNTATRPSYKITRDSTLQVIDWLGDCCSTSISQFVPVCSTLEICHLQPKREAFWSTPTGDQLIHQ